MNYIIIIIFFLIQLIILQKFKQINGNLKYIFYSYIKYTWFYKNMSDLTFDLDKKVDEKTIEYNNLINKQKEFISTFSHEIKWPIATSIFQTDCILDDIKEWNYSKKWISKDLEILSQQLLKSWKLIDNVFSVELYDIKKIKFYKENIKIKTLLKNEIIIFQKQNTNIVFNLNIEKKLGFVLIDKVQFTQVIDNLLTNSTKFVNNKKWIININSYKEDKSLIIEIEDNWIWIKNIDIDFIFDRYSTWIWNIAWTWLWMWLFLCKKIVELHNWTIKSSISGKLWWAKFSIKIPI